MCVCAWDREQVFSDAGDKRWKLNNKSSPAVNGRPYQTLPCPGEHYERVCVSERASDIGNEERKVKGMDMDVKRGNHTGRLQQTVWVSTAHPSSISIISLNSSNAASSLPLLQLESLPPKWLQANWRGHSFQMSWGPQSRGQPKAWWRPCRCRARRSSPPGWGSADQRGGQGVKQLEKNTKSNTKEP